MRTGCTGSRKGELNLAKLAVLFAGQGAQKTGMGKSLYDHVGAAKEVFDEAEQIIPGICDLCFSGAQEELNRTIHTQPCVLTVDVAAYAALMELGIRPVAGAGFSLGEYAALVGAGVLPFGQVLRLVQKRAQWMQEAADAFPGGMAAVLGKSAEEVETMVAKVRGDGVLTPVNYNCPGQTVVAGDTAEIGRLIAYAKENKVKCMKLPVSGAFHSERMHSVAQKTLEEMKPMAFLEPGYTLYSNKTAHPYEMQGFQQILAEQAASPVLFEQIARDMIKNGCDTFVEVGPGAALSGFLKRIDQEIAAYHISDYDTLCATKEALGGIKF